MEPITSKEWTPALAAHLLNRAGFGGSPADIEKLCEVGPARAVESLVDYGAIAYSPPVPDFADDGPLPPDPKLRRDSGLPDQERRKRQQIRRREQRRRLAELRKWWLERMHETPRPLEEKLTVFWHGHFATSFVKVKSAYAMYIQNETFREHANGSFEDLVVAVSRDPAMLLYLDGAKSQKKSPNENYARELMELFTLGEGHYTETDIQESARAFTGWTIDRRKGKAVFRPPRHDGGRKEFMGESGQFGNEDIVRILIRNPQCARFICGKLWSYFAYEDPEESVIDALTTRFRQGGYELKPVLKSMFMSRAFYSKRAGRTQIKSPVQWLISSLNYTESPLPDPGLCTYMLERLGQRLFEPPNVKGWEGGYTWITAATLVDRYNLAGVLTKGSDEIKQIGGAQMERQIMRSMNAPMMSDGEMNMGGESRPAKRGKARARVQKLKKPVVDPNRVLPPATRTSAENAHAHLRWRLFQADLRAQDREAFEAYFESLSDPSAWTDDQVRDAVHAMMSTPHFQLT